MIYLDNAATTFPKQETVYREMDKVNRTLAVNTGRGSYESARKAQFYIDDSRQMLSKMMGCDENNLVFAPSVTYALNQIIFGLPLSGKNIYISPYEHNAVARTLELSKRNGAFNLFLLPLCKDLQIDLEKTKYLFSLNKPDYVFMTKISNVTGYVLPTSEVFALAKEYNAITILDGAQAAGLIEITLKKEHADFICFAGHKTLGGPFGIGGYASSGKVILKKSIAGGTGSDSLNLDMPEFSPNGYEIGSPNIIAISGLWASLNSIDIPTHLLSIQRTTSFLYRKLSTLTNIRLLGAYDSNATLGIISFVVDGYSSSEVGQILNEEYDIAVRTGYHCAPYIHEYLKDLSYEGTVRVGVSSFTTENDINTLVDALNTL